MSSLIALEKSIDTIKRAIDGITDFLSVSLRIANAHTVDFYTRHVWKELIAVPPDSVLAVICNTSLDHEGAPDGAARHTYGFCEDTKRLVDVGGFLRATKLRSLPASGVCVPLQQLMDALHVHGQPLQPEEDGTLEPDEFMNSKKSHEVQILSEVVVSLARCCRLQQVVDVGSGKGYLCSFLSLRYGLRVYGVDSSSSNTHGARERNRKLKKYSKAYRRRSRTRARGGPREAGGRSWSRADGGRASNSGSRGSADGVSGDEADVHPDGAGPEPEDPFLGLLPLEAAEPPPFRAPPAELSPEERERRKQENLERKSKGSRDEGLYSPLTSYVTAETELREIIAELEDAVLVGLHTCGDLAPSTLRMFAAKPELRALCSVSCCYHLLSEEFDQAAPERPVGGVWGFPMSQYLRDQAWFCGRNARMSACLALERVAVGKGLPTESLFYRAVFHVILQDHYNAFKSEKRVGNVYSKAGSFVDYVRKALRKLELDESKLSDSLVQSYHDKYRPRMKEMEAFNMLKVSLAPCIEGLILLDRLCYLKEQEKPFFCELVRLFDPLMSPRCYGIIGLKKLQM
ncbi:putative methyltransferase-like protein 25 [Scleropages formosus]|uniref:Methyltransferase like 25 n=1 Tax=Scleropages formosus TaxID=113540 RepID=A0A8C9V1W6_SCLFO|nr:methyltransferase-like protein 25 [Scleropages formosus]